MAMTGVTENGEILRNPTQSNQSAERLLLLLEAMSVLDEPIRLHDLAEKLGMNASTIHRFLTPLQQKGYVNQDPDTGRYHLTFKICGLADNVSSRLEIRKIAFPFLRNMARIFQESANLSIEEADMSILYVEVVTAPGKTLMTTQRIGHAAPMHCTGIGKILLLEYGERKLDQLIGCKGLPRFTENTITDKRELLAALEEIRKNGYAFDNEECEVGARCIAAPIRNYANRIVAGISVSGPVSRMTDSHVYANLPYLLEAAEQISHRLGWKT